MSVVWIVVIVVVVVLVAIGLFLLLPRFREQARIKKRERELGQRREQAVSEHRGEAERRERRAEVAEHKARIAEQEAQRERAEAQLGQERAALHERGMADHELIDEDERQRFAGTSADSPSEGAQERTGADQEPEQRTSAYQEGREAAHDPSRVEEFREGRRREQG